MRRRCRVFHRVFHCARAFHRVFHHLLPRVFHRVLPRRGLACVRICWIQGFTRTKTESNQPFRLGSSIPKMPIKAPRFEQKQCVIKT